MVTSRPKLVDRYVSIKLTSDARHCLLLVSCHKNQLARTTPAKMVTATLGLLRVLCGDWLLCRIPKSKLSSTLRNGQKRGSRRPLPALPTAQRQRAGPGAAGGVK